MVSQPRPPVVGSTRWVKTPWFKFKMFNVQWLMHKKPTRHSMMYSTGARWSYSKKEGRGSGGYKMQKCLACTKISVLSLIKLKTNKGCMTSDKVFEMRWFSGVVVAERAWLWPKLGLVTAQYTTCSAAVPCVPWSRAMPHSLGQVVWVAILAARDVLWCWLASLRQAFQSDIRINFLIPCRPWEF